MTAPLIEALRDPACYDHPVSELEVFETHISWVILTGRYAYKVKKPVNFGFLDFSTPERRKYYCDEEVRLNRRLAPDWYLGVVTITGTPDRPRMGGAGEPLDYAVQMRQFPSSARLDHVLARGELSDERLDDAVSAIASFHSGAGVAGPDTPFGTPERIADRVFENVETIRANLPNPSDGALVDELGRTGRSVHAVLTPTFLDRKARGFIRECHGDLHLGNMAWVDGKPVIFDCIEFNADLRWIDVISEIAFLVMDLRHRRAERLAHRALNRYLEETGDYAGLRVFAYYYRYRALVRAKVACLSAAQEDRDEAERMEARAEAARYLGLAVAPPFPDGPLLVLMHGVSGSGKSHVAELLVGALGAVRIRSDVERKRLFGVEGTKAPASVGRGVYTDDATARTYARLADLADHGLQSGVTVVVDATFLKRAQRDVLGAVGARHGVRTLILAARAPLPVMRQRIVDRERRGHDASDADLEVLDSQLKSAEPLGDDEGDRVMTVDTDGPIDLTRLVARVRSLP